MPGRVSCQTFGPGGLASLSLLRKPQSENVWCDTAPRQAYGDFCSLAKTLVLVRLGFLPQIDSVGVH